MCSCYTDLSFSFLYTDNYLIINKKDNLYWVRETDGYRQDVIFIMVVIIEVSCGARNDKSLEAGVIY